MNNYTLTTTLDDFDAYSIEMDTTCISQDYETADTIQKEYEITSNNDTDIQFE